MSYSDRDPITGRLVPYWWETPYERELRKALKEALIERDE